MVLVVVTGKGGFSSLGLAGFSFHCRLHILCGQQLWLRSPSQGPPQGIAPARNMGTRRGVELLQGCLGSG